MKDLPVEIVSVSPADLVDTVNSGLEESDWLKRFQMFVCLFVGLV